MNKDLWMKVQQKLADRGLYKRTIDGIPGIGTRTALKAWQRKNGQQVMFPPDARQLKMLGLEPPKQSELIIPPWGVILLAKRGLHEARDTAALAAFLKSDGRTLGDPRKWPWCGDLVETCQLNAGFGPVPGNPYLARNWLEYGVKCPPLYYAIGVAERPGPNGNEGHVCYPIGINKAGDKLYVQGGNQQNQIGEVWMAADRFLGFRKPENYKGGLSPLPVVDDNGQFLSTNEA